MHDRPVPFRISIPLLSLALAAALLSAACGDEGGELKDATARRRAEMANRDTTRGHADSTRGDSAYTIPAFVGDTPVRAAKTDSAARPAADSAKAATPAKPAAADSGWTTSALAGTHRGATGVLRGLRVAQHDGFDRLVLDFGTGAVPGWHVEYVDAATQCGSGRKVKTAGTAVLLVRLRTAQAHDDAGQPTIRQRDLPLTLPVLRQMVMTCDFEGGVEVVLGVAARQPFRVMDFQGPSRIVVDVKQP
ncbi:MAG: hypothetical protein JO306_15185 [Gemmatimonadetes bacterium]|nr:hypothetical protein [Gemmatimonadota bacterium]